MAIKGVNDDCEILEPNPNSRFPGTGLCNVMISRATTITELHSSTNVSNTTKIYLDSLTRFLMDHVVCKTLRIAKAQFEPNCVNQRTSKIINKLRFRQLHVDDN